MIRFAFLIPIVLLTLPPVATAGDTLIYIGLSDHSPRIGDTIEITASILMPEDTLAGFTMSFYFTRPGLLAFRDELTPKTAGTLIEGWESIRWRTFGEINALLRATADEPPLDGEPPQPGPITSPTILVRLVAAVPCFRDQFADYEGFLIPQPPQTFFTDPAGPVIAPFSIQSASINVQRPLSGDVDRSGVLDIVDVVATINCAFRGTCKVCGEILADVDCSGTVDMLDIARQVDVVFRATPSHTCP